MAVDKQRISSRYCRLTIDGCKIRVCHRNFYVLCAVLGILISYLFYFLGKLDFFINRRERRGRRGREKREVMLGAVAQVTAVSSA